MKRIVLQVFRMAVTVLVMGTMAAMIFSLRDEVTALRRELGILKGCMPLNAIPIGRPAESPQPKDKWDPAKVPADRR